MYGSIFRMLTFKDLASSTAASEAVTMPLPSEDTTPPVTKMYCVIRAPISSVPHVG